jgi:hypothetical protein
VRRLAFAANVVGAMLTLRSSGDFGIKRCCFDVVSNEPEFTILQLCEEDRLLILASDGVWATVRPIHPFFPAQGYRSPHRLLPLDYQVTADRAVDMVMEKVINLSSYIDRIGPAEYLVQEAVSKGSGTHRATITISTMLCALLITDSALLAGVLRERRR